jgi:hypothetical protein
LEAGFVAAPDGDDGDDGDDDDDDDDDDDSNVNICLLWDEQTFIA